jgi:hypothetical protein
MTGIIYRCSSDELLYRNAVKTDVYLTSILISTFNDLFGVYLKNVNDIFDIVESSKGDWFIPLILIYGKKIRKNIVSAGLNYDKIYVREALGYSRPIIKKDIKTYNIRNSCINGQLTKNNVVMGDSFFKIVDNGVFENVMKKFNKEASSEVTIRLKHQIVSIEGDNDKNNIRAFVEQMLAQDSRALRKHIKDMAPDVNLSANVDINGVEESIDVPISLSFFWPDL